MYRSKNFVNLSMWIAVSSLATSVHAGTFDWKLKDWSFDFSGNINGYLVVAGTSSTNTIYGGLTDAGDDTDTSIRNGLVPAAFVLTAKHREDCYDIGFTAGLWTGINSNNNLGGVNVAGRNIALGTPGVDFRQIFLTVGTDKIGTFKVGRDIVQYGKDALLFDMTIFGVGAVADNQAPSTTSLGRIGVGYLYADWLPQISWVSPDFNNFQLNLGIYQPLDAISSVGDAAANFELVSGVATLHQTPMFVGGLAYTLNRTVQHCKAPDTKELVAKVWSNVLVQKQDARDDSEFSWTGWTAELGGKAVINWFELVVYGYYTRGVGTTGYFINAVSAVDGSLRTTWGGYAQAMVTFNHDKTKLGYSYGQSELDRSSNELLATINLVERNDSHTVGIYHNLTTHVRLVAEYSYVQAVDQADNRNKENVAVLGANLFF